jgi:histidinol-phosphate aminotransferase
MARVFAVTNGLRVIPVPLAPDGDLDADAVVDSGASVAYLCSPNNPTGNRLSRAAVDGVLARFPGLVMIDEAYAEFAGESRAADAPHHGRLLVLRTFSKAFGLAGLRVGYGVAAGHIILELEKVRGPYNVTSLGERAALAALQFDQPWVRATVAQTLSVRDRFVDALRAAGFAPRPSAANFVLVPVGDARAQASKLQARGIGIRPFSGLSGIGDALRITVGPWDVMDEVLAALQAVRSEA